MYIDTANDKLYMYTIQYILHIVLLPSVDSNLPEVADFLRPAAAAGTSQDA